jgi:hypothetical protein
VFILIKISRTSRLILIKPGTNHPCVKGILNCTNKGPVPLQSGDNKKYRKKKIGEVTEKFFLSDPLGQNSSYSADYNKD